MKNWLLALTTCELLLTCSGVCEEAPSYTVVQDLATLPLLNPSLTERKVEKLVLENQLEVYLISDPGTKQSAAGLAVRAGSWDDPEKYPGLAHFLEHMLFLGTKAYPKENEYMGFIADHGGTVNAYTASDRTVYMLSVNHDGFDGAIDRFAHFFIDPLFALSGLKRELHAVDQEHAKNLEHDGWRQYMILKAMGNPDHPHSSFSTGNAKILSGIPQEEVKAWYQTHYTASNMHLVLLSPKPLEELRLLAAQSFSPIPNSAPPAKMRPMHLTSSKQRGHMIFIKPIKDLRELSLVWEVPKEIAQDLDHQVPELLTYVLSHKGEHSLLEYLKEKKLAEEITSHSDRYDENSLLFHIDISLTDQGLNQIETVIGAVYEMLTLLQKMGIPSSLHDELRTLCMLRYQYQSRAPAFQIITELAGNLVYEDLATYPEKTLIPSEYDPSLVNTLLHSLTPDSCIYFVMADPSKTGVLPDTVEKWMQAEYAAKEISEEHLKTWQHLTPNPYLALPSPNSYIPANLSLLPASDRIYSPITPLLLDNDSGSKAYFAQDSHYLVPEVGALFTIRSPLIQNTSSAQALLDLYIHTLQESLSDSLFLAEKVGIASHFEAKPFGLRLAFQGFSDPTPLLITEVFAKLSEVLPSPSQFAIHRSTLCQYYANAEKELPILQARQTLDRALFKTPTSEEKLQALSLISYEQFLDYCKTLFATAYLEGILYGNLSTPDAQTLWKGVKTTLNAEPYLPSEHTRSEVLLLSDKSGPLMISHTSDRQGNGIVLLIEEGAFSFEKRGIQQILGTALQEAFHDTLRTKQQTGYIAKAWNTEKERQLFQYFGVQSNTHQPNELLARFELFLEDFHHNFSEIITEERFQSIRNNLITLLDTPPENMATMLALLGEYAFEYQDFQWMQKRVESLRTISYTEFCAVSKRFLSRKNPRRLAVLVKGVLPEENEFHYRQVSQEEIGHMGSFVSAK